jgi:MFS transporter, NNP family, nitrate/nitrite transporter
MSTGSKKFDSRKWNPEDPTFWAETGRHVANRNLWISIPCLLLAFSVWFIWSAVAVKLNSVGFNFSTSQLFTLAAMPGLTGATFRIFYSFTVPIFGGRNWTVFSTAILLIPAVGIGMAIQDPHTSYGMMLVLAGLCGFGGGSFSSSMSNISYFYPKKEQGMSLGLNAGLGNLGVSVLQFCVPLVITVGVFSAIGGGASQTMMVNGVAKQVWLQNAGYIWVIPIIIATIAAWFGMNNLATAKTSLEDQLVIFKRKHMYLTTWLYIMSFGSYIGFSAAFPLLIKTQFPAVDPLRYAFLGPMLGALIRPVGGWLSDKVKSGAMVTFWDVIIMILAVFGVIYFISPGNRSFWGFFGMFMVLFITTGIANGSVFKMIAALFPMKERGPALGFSAAIAAYGAFLLPKAFGYSISVTGRPDTAFYGFIAYYVTCLFVTWWWYYRRGAKDQC